MKLKQFRLEKDLSLKELAEKSGLSMSYLNEIEKSKKYPKVDKLIVLAKALEIPFEELISMKLHKNLGPLEKYLESDLFKELPLEIFGISHNDLCDLMSESPEKFSAFIVTLTEIARSYDLTFEQLLFAALRAYQEMHKNFFPEIEKAADETRARFELQSGAEGITPEKLMQILKEIYLYDFDEKKLAEDRQFSFLRTFFRPASKEQARNTFFLNGDLPRHEKGFLLSKEIGHQVLGLKKRFLTSSHPRVESFETILNDFKTSYFAGSLMLDTTELVKEMKSLFKEKTFQSGPFLELLAGHMERNCVGPEVFFHRLTQILPKFFHLSQLFFLRFNHDYEDDMFYMTKEMHLSQLHVPHGIGLSEHYCRRWITVSLLKDLYGEIKQGEGNGMMVGVQRSKFFSSDKEYFCFSMARTLPLKKKTTSCITIGLLIDEQFKKTVRFWDDPSVKRKEVSQTCERCGIKDCEERVAPPTIYEKEKEILKKEKLMNEFLRSL